MQLRSTPTCINLLHCNIDIDLFKKDSDMSVNCNIKVDLGETIVPSRYTQYVRSYLTFQQKKTELQHMALQKNERVFNKAK